MLSRSRVQRAAGACATAAVFAASAATGEEPVEHVRLAWVRGDGAEGCLDQDELKRRVRGRLGRDPFADDAKISIEGTVIRDRSGWHADLHIRSDTSASLGTRKLDTAAPDCGAIGEAVVLAMALTIDPSGTSAIPAAAFPAEPPRASLHELIAPPSPMPEPPRAAPPTGPPAPDGRRETAGKTTRTVEVFARGGVGVGVLPGVAPMAALAGSYGANPLLFTVGLSLLPQQETADGRFAFGLTSGSAGACFGGAIGGRFVGHLCGELQAGATHAVVLDSQQLVPLSQGDHLWLAGAGGPRLSWIAAAPLRLEAAALAVVPIVRKAFVIRNTNETVFESAPVAAMAYVGIGVGVP